MHCNSQVFSKTSIPFSLKTRIEIQERVFDFKNPNKCQRFISTGIACTQKKQSTNAVQKQRHFVLVHGACHGAWCWYKVSAHLKSAGHIVTALDMAASGVNPKQLNEICSFSDYFEPFLTFMDSLPPEDRVIVVAHSMGGIGLSIAMEKFPNKISAAIFAAATMPGPDFNFKTIAQKYYSKASSVSSMDTQYFFGNGPNNPPTAVLLGLNYMASKLYYSSPLENLVLATSLVRPFPLFSDPATQNELVVTKERFGPVRRIFILCDQENDDVQRWMIKNNPPDEVKEISGSDHMLMFSKPQDLCSCLLEIGDKYQ